MNLTRRLATVVLTALAALVAAFAFTASASAHSSQIGATPAADEVLAVAPTEVTIEFDVPLIDMGTAIAVRGSAKESIVTGSPTVDGRFLSVHVDGAAPADTYTVAYRVVSEDGHTISSTYTYSVAGEGSPASNGAAEASPASNGSPSPTPIATTTADAPQSTGGVSPLIIGGGVAFIVVLAFVGAIALRRR